MVTGSGCHLGEGSPGVSPTVELQTLCCGSHIGHLCACWRGHPRWLGPLPTSFSLPAPRVACAGAPTPSGLCCSVSTCPRHPRASRKLASILGSKSCSPKRGSLACLQPPGPVRSPTVNAVLGQLTSAPGLSVVVRPRRCSAWASSPSTGRSPRSTWPRLDTAVTVLGQQSWALPERSFA